MAAMTQNWAFLFGYTNIIVNGVIILITILNLVVYKLQKLQKAEFVEQNRRLLSLSIRGSCYRFSLDQMKQATSNFHDDLVIGKGGFGKVYKGTLEVGPTTVVAIKRRRSQSSQGSTEFRMEIEMLSKFRHSHLVSLIGYCDDGYEMILVYEFMQGGTLADHLHKRVMQADKFLPPLSWVQRLKICIGAARGLDYLHTGTGIQHGIIHRDVKTTNILLDENFEAKISDFGLSKISPANQAITYVSTHVKGTFGYFDPYYFATHRLTRKSDVYSFGVVLFEVLCGRPAVDRSLDEDQIGLAGWAQHCFREGLLSQIIDPRIEGEVFTDSLEAFVKVALQCLHPGPKHRPTMAEVVVGLQSALVLQEKSTEYYLAEIITSDSNEEDTDFSSLKLENDNSESGMVDISKGRHQNKQSVELENDNSEKGMLDISKGRHKDKKSSATMTFKKIFGVFHSLTARASSVNPDAKTSRNGSYPVHKSPASEKSGADVHRSKNSNGVKSVDANFQIFKLTDLERATSNFEEVLGNGRSGYVFKGWVDENTYAPSTPEIGLPVAVKRFIPERAKEWQMEIDLSRKYSHPNFVKLFGYCSEGHEHLLVYEYMENRDLNTLIFKSSSQAKEDVRKLLSLMLRLKIMVVVARCLAFFHTAKQRVICHDFKASRVLLDEKFSAKLSPYGLARLTRSDRHRDVRHIVGPLCHEAPEYVESGFISLKTDVYAFGVVLLELMTGTREDEMLHFTYVGEKRKSLLDYANSRSYCLDLAESLPVGPSNFLLDLLFSLITKCIDSRPSKRPSMLEVVEILEPIYWHVYKNF